PGEWEYKPLPGTSYYKIHAKVHALNDDGDPQPLHCQLVAAYASPADPKYIHNLVEIIDFSGTTLGKAQGDTQLHPNLVGEGSVAMQGGFCPPDSTKNVEFGVFCQTWNGRIMNGSIIVEEYPRGT